MADYAMADPFRAGVKSNQNTTKGRKRKLFFLVKEKFVFICSYKNLFLLGAALFSSHLRSTEIYRPRLVVHLRPAGIC